MCAASPLGTANLVSDICDPGINAMSMRCILQLGVGIGIALSAVVGGSRVDAAPSASASAQSSSATAIKELRHKAAERRRRLIFNNDGGDATRKITEPTAQGLLDGAPRCWRARKLIPFSTARRRLAWT